MRTVLGASLVIVVAVNLLPIAGVVWWGWDAFVLLVLYWLETAIIGFWTVVRIIVNPSRVDVNGTPMNEMGLGGRIALGAFITVHAGIFMTVHFIFLWALFSGAWSERIHGVGDFVREMVIGTDLWIPLAFLFVVRGFLVMRPLARQLGIVGDPPDGGDTDNPVVGLYIRIVVMQVTILVGAWFAILAGGTTAALVLLIVLKTVGEVFFDRLVPYLGTREAGGAGSGTAD